MGRISRYVIRAAVAPFFFGCTTVIFLFLMQFLMKTLDKLIGKGLENIVIVQLITYNIAWMVVLAVPMGVLFASLVAFGNLAANHEITVVKASGGSLVKMMMPLIISGGILFGIMFWYNDYILPETNHAAKTLGYDIQRMKPTLAIEAGQFSDAIEGYTILARKVDTATNNLYSVTIYDQRNIGLNRIISAESCKINFTQDLSKLIFEMKNGEIHQSKANDVNNYRIIRFETYSIYTNAYGFGFEHSSEGTLSRGDREMHIADMQKIIDETNIEKNKQEKQLLTLIKNNYNYILGNTIDTTNANKISNDKFVINMMREDRYNFPFAASSEINKVTNQFIFSMQTAGANIKSYIERANAYEVEIHKKYAIPFACFIFVFVGCPLGIITRGGNFGLSAALTLGFYILYWACLIGGEKLADRNMISPALSMWLGNIIVGVFGIIITIKVNNESFSFFPKFLNKITIFKKK